MFSDTVIIGASSVKHLEENLKSTKNGPLHEGELSTVCISETMLNFIIPLTYNTLTVKFW